MKTITFKIFNRTVTIKFGCRRGRAIYDRPMEFTKTSCKESAEEFKMEEKPKEGLVRDWFEYYVAQRRREDVLSESTLRNYENIYKNHLKSLMEYHIPGKLTNEIVQAAFDEEIAKGLSKKTLQNYKSLVCKVFSMYLLWEPEIRLTAKEENDG